MAGSPPAPGSVLAVLATLFAVLWSGGLAAWHMEGRASVLDRIEAPLTDLRLLIAGPRPPPPDIVIVAIDDATVQNDGQFPVARRMMARLVETLNRLQPRTLGVDILFIDPGDAESDRVLAEALSEAGAVIAAAAIFDDGRAAGADLPGAGWANLPEASRLVLPIPLLRRASGTGIVNITTDPSGTPRFVPVAIHADGRIVPSFPLRVASLAAGAEPALAGDRLSIGEVTTILDVEGSLPLRFYGPRRTIPTVSARDILDGTAPVDLIRGRIVIVGSTALGTGDNFGIPFDPIFPGVEVLATAVGHLSTGDGLVRSERTRHVDAAAAMILSVTAILAVLAKRVGLGLAILLIVLTGWAMVTVLAFGQGYWLNLALPVAAVAPPAAIGIAARLWLDRAREQQLLVTQAALRRFQSPPLAAELIRTPEYLLAPTRQDASILFIDLTGFTGLAERAGPERTQILLKQFHTIIGETVAEHGGLVLNYMGDGAMIVFGVPAPHAGDAARAFGCAIALCRNVKDWALGLQPEMTSVSVRIGAHFGPVVLSRLGPESHQHITATGDSVNVASRLLEVARQGGAPIAFSVDLLTAAAVGADPGLGESRIVMIRGRTRPLRVRLWTPVARGP